MKIINCLQKVKVLKVKKEEGNIEFRLGNVQKVYDLYIEVFEIDFFNKFINFKLYFNRVIVLLKVFFFIFYGLLVFKLKYIFKN